MSEDIPTLIASAREPAADERSQRDPEVYVGNLLDSLADALEAVTAERDALHAAIQEALKHDMEWDLPPSAVGILSRAIDTKEQS